MHRRIIEIDAARCTGCGLCAAACHEGAIGMENGKARLLRDDYCDGLGDCLPVCPAGAIRFVEREAAAYDEAAVRANKAAAETLPCGCPGSQARALGAKKAPCGTPPDPLADPCGTSPGPLADPCGAPPAPSELRQWPVQLRLVPARAPWFDGARLLVAADCTAYAYGAFHRDFIRGRVTLIGCPKLDEADYAEKLTDILRENDVAGLTVARMEVPCCGGLEAAARTALARSGKALPLEVVTLTAEGEIL